ncbi:MAG TPA: LTA synthase family protein [Acidiferrobacterales bacterium]
MILQSIKQQFLRGRYFPLLWLAAVYLAVSSLLRVALFIKGLPQLDAPLATLAAVLPIGLFYDIATGFYLFFAYALYLLLLPERVFRSSAHRGFLMVASFAALFGLLYLGPVEYFFFDEFDARFNFVAVAYLLYPHEVFVNIWESYPVGRVLAAVTAATALLFWAFHKPLAASLTAPSRLRERLPAFGMFTLGLAAVVAGVTVETGRYSDNRIANELAQNGIYSFFYALFHNDLDYNHYYLTLSEQEAARRLRRLVAQPNAEFIPGADNPIARHIRANGAPRPLNVVVLVEESLGADFVGAYGDARGLTPNLDRLAKDSLVFTNFYATGTRTVRGLEAISSSFPPIPGESIVKRSHNDHIFTWGAVMRAQGYRTSFLYGGYGSFDGMNGFFGGNGFDVIDRASIGNPTFTNIWGVSDEDLFGHALTVFDAQHARGEKFFALVMSTSNHKPFTFPAGIPGVAPEGGGREAGVRYADYAIGRFIEALKRRPYFDDTLVVIVGDHGARVYGKEDIPMRSYELPMLVYAPRHIAPRRVDILASQIDIAPTVLGLLNISYDSVFFGRDAFAVDPKDAFALVSHNRDVALYRDGKLVELGIRKAHRVFDYDKRANHQTPAADDAERVKDAISIFQEGYNLFARGQYRLDPPTGPLARSAHADGRL